MTLTRKDLTELHTALFDAHHELGFTAKEIKRALSFGTQIVAIERAHGAIQVLTAATSVQLDPNSKIVDIKISFDELKGDPNAN